MNALSPSLLPQPLALVARLIHWLALIIRNLRILALPPSSFAVRRDEAVHTWLNDTKFASRATCMYEFTVARGGDARSQRSTELELRPMAGERRRPFAVGRSVATWLALRTALRPPLRRGSV